MLHSQADVFPGLRSIDEAQPFAPAEAYLEEVPAIEPKAQLPLIDMSQWRGDPPERQSFWGDWLPARQTTLITGKGGAGKSLFTQGLLTSIALGRPFQGMETKQRKTIYVTCEDDHDELWRRQVSICEVLGVSLEEVQKRLHLCSLVGELETALATEVEGSRIEPTDRWRQLVDVCKTEEIGVFAFDNAADALAADQNSSHPVVAFLQMFTKLAMEIDGSAIILHHPNKSGDQWLGSVYWENKVRSRLYIEKEDNPADPDLRAVTNPKANYGQSNGRIEFRWFNGAFAREEDLPTDNVRSLKLDLQVAAENEVFLQCLEVATSQKRNVSHQKGTNYAPKVFARMTEGKSFEVTAFENAMERLVSMGRIQFDQRLWQDDYRKVRRGIALAEKCGDPPAVTPCGDLRRPPQQVIENTCGDQSAATPSPLKGGIGGANSNGPRHSSSIQSKGGD